MRCNSFYPGFAWASAGGEAGPRRWSKTPWSAYIQASSKFNVTSQVLEKLAIAVLLGAVYNHGMIAPFSKLQVSSLPVILN